MRRKPMLKWWFGYNGDPTVYWWVATTECGLLRALSRKGMSKPDWIDPATVPA